MTSTTFGLCESRDSGAEPRKLTFRPADVGVIYIQKGVELLVLEFNVSGQAGEPTVRLFHTSAEADLQLRIRLVQRRRGDLVRLVCLLSRTYRDSSFRSYVPTLHLVVCSRRAISPTPPLCSFLGAQARHGLRLRGGDHSVHWLCPHVRTRFSLTSALAHSSSLDSPGQITSANIEFLDITRSFYPSTESVIRSNLHCAYRTDKSHPRQSQLGRALLGIARSLGLRLASIRASHHFALLLRRKI